MIPESKIRPFFEEHYERDFLQKWPNGEYQYPNIETAWHNYLRGYRNCDEALKESKNETNN